MMAGYSILGLSVEVYILLKFAEAYRYYSMMALITCSVNKLAAKKS